MALSKTFSQVFGIGDMWRRAIYDLISEVEARVTQVEGGVLANLSISTGELANDAVDASKINYFLSTEVTGNGSAQNTPHGLGAIPTAVMIIPSGTASGANTFVQGSHTSTNAVVTATTGAKYYVLALK